MRILKFQISPTGIIDVPEGSTFMSAATQGADLVAWFLCPQTDKTETKRFMSVCTGCQLPDWIGDCRFVATITGMMLDMKTQQAKHIATHLFEIPEYHASKLKPKHGEGEEWKQG